MDKKYKLTMIGISIVGIISIIVLVAITIYLFNNASIIQVMSRLG